MIRVILLAACFAVQAGCRPAKKVERKKAGLDAAAAAVESRDELLAVLELASRETIDLRGGISIQAVGLEEGASPAGTAKARVDFSEKLPVVSGSQIRISPQVEIDSEGQDVLFAVEIPFSMENLPGGIDKRGIHGALLSQETWKDVPSFIVKGRKAVCSVVPAAPGLKVALLARTSHWSPEMEREEGIVAAAAIILQERELGGLRPFPAAGASPGEGAENERLKIFYLDADESKISIKGTLFTLKKIKNAADIPLPFVVTDRAGNVIKSREKIERVLLAWKLRGFFSEETVSRIMEGLGRGKILAEKMHEKECGSGGKRCMNLGFLAGTAGEIVEEIKEAQSVKEEEALLPLFFRIVEVAGKLESLQADYAAGDLSPFSTADLIWHAEKRKGKTMPHLLLSCVDMEGLDVALDSAAAKVHKIASRVAARIGAPEPSAVLTALVPSGQEERKAFLKAASLLYGASGYRDVLESAALVASSIVERAPPPETSIDKWTLSGKSLVVRLKGTDEDGRVTDWRYWIDDPGVPGLVKGAGAVKIDLELLKSGTHTLFMAGVDDDGQEDETPERFSFYLRRFVEVSVNRVEVSFDGPQPGINSEHRRSTLMYASEVEAAVMLCAQEHFRFGVEGKGRVEAGAIFAGGKAAGAPTRRSIISSSYGNKALTGCITKAMRTGKLRYNQPLRPAATIHVTFELEPTLLFFDSKTIAQVPGTDATAAAIFENCTKRAMRKIEGFCGSAVENLPGPWDAETQKEVEGEEEEEDAGEEEGEVIEEKEGPAEDQAIKIPSVEFDPDVVRSDCVRHGIRHLVAKCAGVASKKRTWCVDSCSRKTVDCENGCKGRGGIETDENICIEECWTDLMLPCSRRCILKDTPFEKDLAVDR